MKKPHTITNLLAGLVIALGSWSAHATVVEVNSGVNSGVGSAGGEGGGRAQGIFALDTFTVSSIGIEASLVVQNYDLVIYASTNGSDVGAVLGGATASLGGPVLGFNDIAVDFTFVSGMFYVVNWRPTDLGFSDWVGAGGIQYYNDSGLPVDVGPIRLVDGLEGTNADNSGNFLHPNFRYNIVDVSEPSVIALFGIGLLGVAVASRRGQTRQGA